MTASERCEWRVCEWHPDCRRPVDFTFVLDDAVLLVGERPGPGGLIKPRCVVHRYTHWGERDMSQLFEHIGEASGWKWDCRATWASVRR